MRHVACRRKAAVQGKHAGPELCEIFSINVFSMSGGITELAFRKVPSANVGSALQGAPLVVRRHCRRSHCVSRGTLHGRAAAIRP